jgi:murein DD-endopeptidase MepM/ murein hydrolase activator NlpD
MNQIGNVGRYMNMDNEVAAQSMASLTGGRTSASLLQRGIFTSNPLTGESMKESDIFEQFARRTIVGNMSVDETQDELRRGFLGANIESLDIDAAAKERLKMYLIARAGGEKVDFSSQESMARVFGEGGALKGYTNPFADIYKANVAETGAIEDVSGEFAKGLAAGVVEIEKLYSATYNLRQNFGALGAALSTILGNDLGATLGNPITAVSMYAAAGMTNAITDITTGGTSAQNQLSGFFGGLASLFGLVLPGEGGTGGGGMGDVSLGSNLSLPVPAGSMPSAGYGKEGSQFWDGTHNGIDYAVAEGTPVYAAADGEVIAATESSLSKGYGKYVRLKHSNGYDTIYAHLSEILVREGQQVKRGHLLGKSGSTGTKEAHLHFEVQNSTNDVDLRPSQFPALGTGGSATGGGSLLDAGGASGFGSPLVGGSSTSSYASMLLSGNAGGTTVLRGGSSGPVTIHVNVASASESEAVRFAEIVKQKLEEDSFMAQMGAK